MEVDGYGFHVLSKDIPEAKEGDIFVFQFFGERKDLICAGRLHHREESETQVDCTPSENLRFIATTVPGLHNSRAHVRRSIHGITGTLSSPGADETKEVAMQDISCEGTAFVVGEEFRVNQKLNITVPSPQGDIQLDLTVRSSTAIEIDGPTKWRVGCQAEPSDRVSTINLRRLLTAGEAKN